MTSRFRHGRIPVVVAILATAAVLLSGCGFRGLYGAPLPGGANVGSHPYTITAYFTDVLDLVPQSAVKVNDVPVGRVESVALSSASDPSGDPKTNGWTARVKLKVNGDVKLPANARAEILQTSLLGEKYVALEQPIAAPSKTRLANGMTIPVTRTGSAPEVEEVLGALSLLLNGGGLQQIRVITTELNKALSGNPSAIRDLLTQLNSFVGTLDQQKAEILDSLDSLDRLTTTLDEQKQKIVDALDTFPQALAILKDDRTKIVDLLSSLSHLGTVATHVITATQQDLVATLKTLAAPVEQLTASGSNLVNALKIGGTFPFPLGATRGAIVGDYANLNAYLNLNLSDELCGLSKALCSVVSKLPLSKTDTSISSAANSTAAGANSTLIGAGR